MYLAKLDIFGFKSFAQKTAFTFNEGLTGIIGPNGCGKSNVVDAIRWVLGEQRPSVLRCDRMENLIFNGTATRKPLGLAEVSMHIENTKNILPSEYSEIKITRRLYRSGESEYLINNQPSRLMDIINLFADTGMGADAYSVIELKMVEQILSDNAQERRRLFEEAAGIKKYKARRKSALNKLETTQQELTRLDDILAEVQKNVNSLSRQVGKAQRYHEYKQQLKEKELVFSYLKIHSYRNQLQPLETELEQVNHSKNALGTELHKMEAETEKQQAQAVEAEQLYRQKAAALHQRDEAITELQNRRQLRRQKIESLQEAVAAYRQEIELQRQKLQQLAAERQTLQTRLEETRREMDAAQERYREFANRQLEGESRYQKLREEHQRFVQANLQELQQSAAVKEAYQKILIEKQNLSERLARSAASLEKVQTERRQREETLRLLEKSLQESRAEAETYRQETAHLEKTLAGLREARETLRSEINREEGNLEKLHSRKDFLENLIRNYEGFSQSVQYVMARKSEYAGVVDTLANLVDCAAEYRPALESYLAEVSNYLVVEALETAREILKHLRSQGKGRLTLVPLPLLNSENHSAGAKTLPANGKALPLKQIVTYSAPYEKLFDFLFDSVYLVADLDAAITLRREHPHLTFVTREGDILEHWGNLTGGAAANQMGLIGRQDQYRKLLEELETLQNRLAAHRDELEANTRRMQQAEQKLAEFAELQNSLRDQILDLEKKTDQLSYELNRLAETARDLEAEAAQQSEALQQSEERETALLPGIRALQEKQEAYQAQEKTALAGVQEAEQRFKELTQATQEQQIVYLNLAAREKELLQQLQFIDQGEREAVDYQGDRERKILENQAQVEGLQKENLRIESELENAYRERDGAEQQKNEIEKQVQELRAHIQAAEVELKKRQKLWNQARERIQELELRIKELQVKLANVSEQVVEKYGAAALEFDIKSLDPALSLAEVQTDIDELKEKLERLGDVNPLAIKEHEQEKERLTFLTTQREDLLSARDQLLETIQKLNSTARKQFMDTFKLIETNFQRVFQEFFEGGKAELLLIESRDPLEANIDISVTHKGKQLNTLSLLSAGEKTLTAISLLFAIYLVKPSPFCILDEVDAPLDDVNIGRFTKALNLFARDTQFILVTHNKKTMEATDSIYGVTMEEQGVSKVVSVKFE
ncbi:MAG: chromosome segregation protein SMC [Calditrichaceae bacterium]|nr:chromosome segregation protein SMC [Calditrichia bacterium]NUQ43320.1 chromosome segregation protein SMC [Calditrichaceae bacterium]